MSHDELLVLLARARAVLDHYMFDDEREAIRDDIAEICMTIDDALPDEGRVPVRRAQLDRSMLQRSAA